MTVVAHLRGQQSPPQDITCEEVGLWVAQEYFDIKDDVFCVVERIGRELTVIESNGDRSEQFPNAHFAHETLLSLLEDRYLVLVDEAVSSFRVLH